MTQEALIVGTAPISSFVIACLKLAMNPADSLSRAIYNHFSAKPSFDAELTEEEVVFLKSLRLFPPEEAFERIVMRYDLQERREEIAYLQAVHEQIINFCAGRVADIPSSSMVGRTGKRPLAERRAGRNDHRNHHDTQGQGIGKKR